MSDENEVNAEGTEVPEEGTQETTDPTLEAQLEAATQANEELLVENGTLKEANKGLVARAEKHDHHVRTLKGQISNLKKKGGGKGVEITRHN